MDFTIILRDTLLTNLLQWYDVLNIACTYKAAFETLKALINSTFFFRYPGNGETYCMYSPQRIRIGGFFGSTEEHPPAQSHRFALQLSDLPPNLTHLVCNNLFNSPVDHLLPPTLTHLTFGIYFNNSVDALPPNLTHLHLGKSFQREVHHLPQTLTHLLFRESFDSSIEYLPHSLLYLKIGTCFSNFTKLPTKYPPNLTSLDVLHFVGGESLPKSLISLRMVYEGKPVSFPPNLQSLLFYHTKDEVTESDLAEYFEESSIPSITFPKKLQELTLFGNFSFPALPSSLTRLSLKSYKPFSSEFKKQLPQLSQLTHLSLFFLQEEKWATKDFPPSITHLTLGTTFGIDMTPNIVDIDFQAFRLVSLILREKVSIGALPTTLKCLHLRTDQALLLPPNLEELEMNGGSFTNSEFPPRLRVLNVETGNFSTQFPPLPDGLEELVVGVHYNFPFTSLPPELRKLQISNDHHNQLPPLPPHLRSLVIGTFESTVIPAKNFIIPKFPPLISQLSLLMPLEVDTVHAFPSRVKDLLLFSLYPLPTLPLTVESILLNYSNNPFLEYEHLLFAQ